MGFFTLTAIRVDCIQMKVSLPTILKGAQKYSCNSYPVFQSSKSSFPLRNLGATSLLHMPYGSSFNKLILKILSILYDLEIKFNNRTCRLVSKDDYDGLAHIVDLVMTGYIV